MSNGKKTKNEVPTDIAEATVDELFVEEAAPALELIINETPFDRREKRIAHLRSLQLDVAANIHDLLIEATDIDARIVVEADRFTLEGNEQYETAAVDAIKVFLRTVEVTDTLTRNLSEPVFIDRCLGLSLYWYDLETEYNGAEGLHAQIDAWKTANPMPIADQVIEDVRTQLGLFVRVEAIGAGEPVGDVNAALQSVYNRIARGLDENGNDIRPIIGNPIALTSNEEGSSNYAVDLLRGAKRYASNEEFAAALVRARAIAKTVLANRYGIHIGVDPILSGDGLGISNED